MSVTLHPAESGWYAECAECQWRTRVYAAPDTAYVMGSKHTCERGVASVIRKLPDMELAMLVVRTFQPYHIWGERAQRVDDDSRAAISTLLGDYGHPKAGVSTRVYYDAAMAESMARHPAGKGRAS